MTDDNFCEQTLHEKQQRDITRLYNVPLARFTPGNPYLSGQFTKMQLDMRRKVEILKYSANKSSTQTNNLTKSQKFAMLARGTTGTTTKISPSTKGNVDCSADKLIPRPTSSSGVPGPVTYLYEDSAVPLYNYSGFNTRTYPDYVPNNMDPWQFEPIVNQVYYTSEGIADYLIIKNNIDRSQYNYTVATPLGITIGGNIPAYFTYSGAVDGFVNLTVDKSRTLLNVYYNSSLVNSFSPLNTETIYLKIRVPPNPSSNPIPFSASQFVGNLVFNNVELFTESSYVYSFYLVVKSDVTTNSKNLVSYTGIIPNITPDYDRTQSCTVIVKSGTINSGPLLSAV
jgi:hypothetical protein